MGYQVGVTPLQMVAAVSAVANGGELVEPRVVRAVYRDNRRYAVEPKVVRRTISADTAATLTGIMEGVVERGTAKLAQIPGYTIAGKTGTAAKLVERPLLDVRVQRLVRRLPAVAESGGRDHRRHRLAAHQPEHRRLCVRADLQADRRSDAAVSRRAPHVDPEPPVLVARRRRATCRPRGPTTAAPMVSLVADETPGTVPDLRGLSAREATQRLAKLGLTARLSGDGFVVSQDPPPGTPLESANVCRLTLDRSPARLLASVAAMTWAELSGVLRERGLIKAGDRSRRGAGGRLRHRRGVTTRARSNRARCSSRSRASTPTARCSRSRRSSAARWPWSREQPPPPAVQRAVGRSSTTRGSRSPLLADAFHRHPSGEMQVVGITGTNGKTTTAYLIAVDLRSGAESAAASSARSRYTDRRRAARGDAHDAGSARRCRGCCARWSIAAAARARWKSRRTRCRCGGSTA